MDQMASKASKDGLVPKDLQVHREQWEKVDFQVNRVLLDRLDHLAHRVNVEPKVHLAHLVIQVHLDQEDKTERQDQRGQ